MAMNPTSDDNELEADGVPDLFEAPPGQDVELDQEGMIAPGERPGASVDYGITRREERIDEPISERVRREQPDFSAGDLRHADEEPMAPRMVSENAEVDSIDAEDDAVAVGSADIAGLSAEESAMHVTSEDVADDVSPARERREYTEGR